MTRIERVFRNHGPAKFIGFTVAGDPDMAASVRIAKALIEGGTDILELGVPFSDPVADGPTIQKADERALAAGTNPDTIFSIVREIRTFSDVPIVLLCYYNTVYRRGIERFCRDAGDAGVDGILVADLPVEESEEMVDAELRYGIDPISLVTQTTSDERMLQIIRRSRGYLYLVSALGVTGTRESVAPEALALVARVRKQTKLPLALGFGISTPEHVKTCAHAGADAVIVGSAIVAIVEKNLGNLPAMERELREYVCRMKAAGNTEGTCG